MLPSALALAAALACAVASVQAATPPKVIFHVIVDDLGWGDVAWHRTDGSAEHTTPHMNALRAAGVELNRHYVHKMCTPTRSSYLSGRLPVHVQLTLDNPEAPDAGIPRNMTCIASKLKELGYATHIAGKYDMGVRAPRESTPSTHLIPRP